jgi:hypothetical protein
MRIRKYLIGVMAGGLLGALTFSGVSSAAVTALTITSPVTPTKQDKKIRGPASTVFTSSDTHSGITVPPGGVGCAPPAVVTIACKYYPPSTQTFITFPTDFKFDPGNLVDCNLASLQGKDTASARAACPKSIVGGGTSLVHTLTEAGTPPGNPGTLNGTITAFNGSPSGGNATLYLLTDIAGVATKPILTGTFAGNTLTVQIPPVTGTVIESFTSSINKVVVGKKKNKKTGKTTKKYYLSSKCSKKIWTTTSTNTYANGQQLSATTSTKCTQKKKKK